MPEARPDRKREILDAAFSVLLAEGLPHVSYDRIAGQAGVTRQLVRYYFPQPDDLMTGLADALAARYLEALTTLVAGRADEDRLHSFFDFYFDLIDGTAKPRDDQVYDALFSLAAGSPPIRRNLREQYTRLGHAISHEVRTCYPEIPLQSCAEISYLFVCLMYGHWKMVATLGLSPEHRRITRRSIDRIIASYRVAREPVGVAGIWRDAQPG